jgi:DNA-binding HxlR family transcriptional regulator
MHEDSHCTDEAFCPQYHHAVELIGRRWTGAIIRAMLHGATRFGDLRANVPELSDKMLSQRLKELEAEAVVERRVTPETPVRIEYRLTEKGRELDRAVRVLEAWADEWVDRPSSSATRPAAEFEPDRRTAAPTSG